METNVFFTAEYYIRCHKKFYTYVQLFNRKSESNEVYSIHIPVSLTHCNNITATEEKSLNLVKVSMTSYLVTPYIHNHSSSMGCKCSKIGLNMVVIII